ncbi:cholecystokinin receptor type A-like isoform X2 [Octopus sinensis]|uniref:Cholecystokinin receptor type A-like isoform X2 n=1 Tax=Octopus sinensis TaxID=2607531 RepID=A0A7E6FCK6_9MOLL|nr:cholecystokinin receptor type A-like isoform X2 [Octopus sinensis]
MEQNNSVNICVSILELNTKITYLGISMALGTIGNCFVSYIYYYKFDATATHMFIIALSVCDFLTCIICIPMDVVILHFSYTFHNDAACRVIRYVVAVAVINSALIVFVIAVDRYILICRPLKQNISVRNSKKILAFFTIFTLIVSIPAIFVHGKQNKMVKRCGNIGKECSLIPYINGTIYSLAYYSFVSTVCCCMLIILLIIYLLIGMRIWKIYKAKKIKAIQFRETFTTRTITKLEDQFTDSRSSVMQPSTFAHLKKQSMPPARSNLIFFIITLVWIIAYIPHFGGVFWMLLVKDFEVVASDKELVINKLLTYSLYLSSALNPYIYGLFNRQFRNELLALFRNLFKPCNKKNIEIR